MVRQSFGRNTRNLMWRVAVVVFAIGILFSRSLAAENDTVMVSVVSARVLNDTLIVLEKQLGCLITCEEAPSRYLPTITELFPGGPAVPVTRMINFSYRRDESPESVIRSLIEQYNRQNTETIYRVDRSGVGTNIFNVFPVNWKNCDNRMEKHESPLASVVSIPIMSEDSFQALARRILDLVKSPYELKLAVFGSMSRMPVGIETNLNEKTALFCMNAVVDAFRAKPKSQLISWSLRRGPHQEVRDDFSVVAVRQIDLSSGPVDTIIRIEGEKPLAVAVRVLEKMLDCVISYEDHEYVFERDMFLSRAREPQQLSGGVLEFAFRRAENKEQIIRGMLASFLRYGVFDVSRISDDCFAVYPVKSYDKQGKLVPAIPFSQRQLDLTGNPLQLQDVLVACTEVLARESGKDLRLGDLPKEIAQSSAPFISKHAPVMIGLMQLLRGVDPKLSWQLLYCVKTRRFVLRIHKIGDLLPGIWMDPAITN